MKQRLCTLVYNCSEELSSLLDTIGIWYENKSKLSPSAENYSLIIIDGRINDKRTRSELNQFSNNGGSILQISIVPQFLPCKTIQSYVKRLVFNDEDAGFFKTRYVDLFDEVAFVEKSDSSNSFFSFEESANNGFTGFLGLNPASIFTDNSYTRKRFASSSNPSPDEIVSEISRDSVIDVFEATIEKMFHLQGLPFIKKWTSPSKKPVFAFRIDTDYGDQKSLNEIYNLLEDYKLRATWFLHVKAHESWLDFFDKFKTSNHELALHGYKHATSTSSDKIKNNIQTGLTKLNEFGISTKGYAAPYAIWNDELANVLNQFEFQYSSEFTRGYDSLPFFDENNHLQIPIHPICTGSFSRLRYSLEDVEKYFKTVFKNKVTLWKPILFYHHPLQYGLQIFDSIFKEVVQQNLCNLTFLEYARFWRNRNETEFTATIDNQKVRIESQNDTLLYISNKPDSFELIESNEDVFPLDFNSPFKYDTSSLPSANEINELSNNKLRLLKTSLIDWKNRVRL